jgi:hypothetical protein
MSVTGRRPSSVWPRRKQRQALAALLLAGASAWCEAREASASFQVKVDLLTELKNTAECGQTTTPGPLTSVTIKCSAGAPIPANTPRFVLNMYDSGMWLGTVDGLMTTGTVTSWRVVRLVNRDYLEIVVGW